MEEKVESKQGQVVVDRASGQWSDLWKKEDYWAIWLGFFILIVGLIIYLPRGPADMREKLNTADATLKAEAAKAPFKTIAWHKAKSAKKFRGTDTSAGKAVKYFTNTPQKWVGNPIDAFYYGKSAADEANAKAKPKYEDAKAKEETAFAAAQAAEAAAEAAGFKDEALNKTADDAINAWQAAHAKASSAKSKASTKPYNLIPSLIALMIVLGVFFGIGIHVMGRSFVDFFKGFIFVFIIAVLAYMGGKQATMSYYGIGDPAWAIIFGMLISNTVGTPKWVMPAVQTEYYIKTGLVLLGAEILFGKILAIGTPGIFVAWVVTPIVLVGTFIFGQKVVKMPSKTLNITISADMSVCGVSAAIATAAACRAKKEELTLAVGLSLVFTAIMMVAMPAFIKAVGMPYILGGAWMGGTIDATGAVAAAGAFLSDKALYVAATIKMIQNVLIGVTAFFVALYWVAKIDRLPGQAVSAMEIWYRFPKFVIGFIIASIIYSLLDAGLGKDISSNLLDHGAVRGFSRLFRGWFFCLAFTSIGLATNFRELAHYFKGGKPLILYVSGQTFNLILTLLMAYVMFYKVFPEITARI
ncbi:MAG: putative sulfate exporter family transporter [Thermodesulfobacteriota bacterium]